VAKQCIVVALQLLLNTKRKLYPTNSVVPFQLSRHTVAVVDSTTAYQSND